MSIEIPLPLDDPSYLVQLKPNSAQIAQRNLRRQGFGTFQPLISDTQRRGARFIERDMPLFPGYLFVSVPAGSAPWRTINSTRGVSRLVSFAGKPAQVPPALMRELHLRCNADNVLQPHQIFSPGESVTLRSGPFAGLVGEVIKTAPDQRVWVLLDVLGRRTPMSVDAAAI